MDISHITTKNGEDLPIGDFTVLVGPNNAGKTQTLQDVLSYMQNPDSPTTIVEEVGVTYPSSYEDLLCDFDIVDHSRNTDQKIVRDLNNKLSGSESNHIYPDQIKRVLEREDTENLLNRIGTHFILFADAESRLQIARSAESHDAGNEPPSNALQAFYESDEETQLELRSAFRETFDHEIRFDYSSLQNLRFRVADEFETIPKDPKEARSVLSQYQTLDGQGHGFRSFVGIIISLLLSGEKTVLLDEPEAFLHPAQARQLGSWMAEYSDKNDGKVIVATHDSDFISGILSRDTNAVIYRLDRPTNTHTSFREISPRTTSRLAQDPLLSSQRVVEGIFHQSVVICEGGSDRSVYRSVALEEFGTDEILFIDALGKYSIKDIADALTDADIPTAAIVDIDMLNDRDQLKHLLKNIANVEYPEIEDQLNSCGEINKETTKEEWKLIKEQGVSGFSACFQEDVRTLIEDLKQYHIYVVSEGQLEDWMDLGVRKQRWPAVALDQIQNGECSDNLRDFIEEVINGLDSQYEQIA